jgi:uronate dehydrogenase
MKVLVTGAFGWTAESIIQALHAAGHKVIGFDLPEAECPPHIEPLLEKVHRGDVGVLAGLYIALNELDAVIHLAVATGRMDYQTPTKPFETNVRGTYDVFEAARQQGVKRVILASSAPVHLMSELGTGFHAVTDYRSSPDKDHLYDLTKRLQEEIAKDFCATYGMSCVTLRFGHIVDSRQGVDAKGVPLKDLTYAKGGWVCRYDVADACLHALTFEQPGYHAFHVIGAKQARQHFDLERTEQIFGFVPKTAFDA